MSAVLGISTAESFAMIVVATCVGGALWWSQRTARRAATARPVSGPADSAAGIARPDDLRRWEVEMHELARSMTAEVNMRIAVLQQLLGAAEAQAARLEALLEQHAQQPTGNQAASLTERADSAHAAAPLVQHRPRREQILALARDGAGLAEIVAATGAPPGEVELILGLRRAAAER